MISIVIDYDKLKDAPRVPGRENLIKLKVLQLVNVSKGGSTHVVTRLLKEDEVEVKEREKLKTVGWGRKEIVPRAANPEGCDFFLLFAEGGSVPVYKHKNYAEAVKQSEYLAEKLQKRIYIITPVSFIEPAKPVEEMVKDDISELTFAEVVPKKIRKRIPVKTQLNKIKDK